MTTKTPALDLAFRRKRVVFLTHSNPSGVTNSLRKYLPQWSVGWIAPSIGSHDDFFKTYYNNPYLHSRLRNASAEVVVMPMPKRPTFRTKEYMITACLDAGIGSRILLLDGHMYGDLAKVESAIIPQQIEFVPGNLFKRLGSVEEGATIAYYVDRQGLMTTSAATGNAIDKMHKWTFS